MKTLCWPLLLLISSPTWAGRGVDAWRVGDFSAKVAILEAYREWYSEASALGASKMTEWQKKKIVFINLFSQAWAADANYEQLNCIYAGWPSQASGDKCNSPARSPASGYSAGSCAGNQMACQPLLFGEGLCALVDTQEHRSLAFNQCKEKFEKGGPGATEKLVKGIIADPGKTAQLEKLLNFADGICKTDASNKSMQKTKGVCRILRQKLADIRQVKEKLKQAVQTVEPVRRVLATIGEGTTPCTPELVQQPEKPEKPADPELAVAPIIVTPPVVPLKLNFPPLTQNRPAISLAGLPLTEASECADLQVNNTKVVNKGGTCSDDPVSKLMPMKTAKDAAGKDFQYKDCALDSAYALTKVSDNRYVANVALDFPADVATDDVKSMVNKLNGCMAEVAPYLKGPNGEQLDVHLSANQIATTMQDGRKIASVGATPTVIQASELPEKLRPRSHLVDIRDGKGRWDAGDFYKEFNCADATHEILHLMGLVDEYKETERDVERTQCRQVPSVNSIMKDNQQAFRDATDQELTCPCDEKCQLTLAEANPAVKAYYLAANIYDLPQDQQQLCKPSAETAFAKAWNVEKGEPPFAAPLVVEERSEDGSFTIKTGRLSRDVISDTARSLNISALPVVCRCEDPKDQACQTKLTATFEEAKKLAVPGTPSRICPVGSGSYAMASKSAPFSTVQADPDKKIYKVPVRGDGRSLLAPNHFYRIMAGTCEKASPTTPVEIGAHHYLECARYANSGETGNCGSPPTQCTDPAYFLGIESPPKPAPLIREVAGQSAVDAAKPATADATKPAAADAATPVAADAAKPAVDLTLKITGGTCNGNKTDSCQGYDPVSDANTQPADLRARGWACIDEFEAKRKTGKPLLYLDTCFVVLMGEAEQREQTALALIRKQKDAAEYAEAQRKHDEEEAKVKAKHAESMKSWREGCVAFITEYPDGEPCIDPDTDEKILE